MKDFCLKFLSLQLLVIFSALCWQAQRGEAQADEPWRLIGTWKLNIAKSKFNPGPPPKSLTIKFEWDGDRVKHTAERVSDKGEKIFGGWIINSDGEATPLGGESEYDKVSVKRMDAYTSEVILKKAGKEIMSFKRVVARDGKTVTMTRKGINASGQSVNNVEVYDRQ